MWSCHEEERMKRGLGWMWAMGLGAMLMAGCQGQGTSPEEGRPNEPGHQKNQPPMAGAGQGGHERAGETGVATDPNWEQHPSNEGSNRQEDRGPYFVGRPQEVPRERQPTPFGVGSGGENARKMAIEQLK